MDQVPHVLSVLFVGDFFSLITTVVLEEEGRLPGEIDEEDAVRLASSFMKAHYGWDVEAVSNEIGVVGDEIDE